MYCPKCSSATVDNAKYCRACGADISLVPMALTGELAKTETSEDDAQRAAQLSKAVGEAMTGIGFFVVSFCILFFMPAGSLWWFWMLIPAFVLLGGALSKYVRYARKPPTLPQARARDEIGASRVRELESPGFTGAIPPPSITEDTTRELVVPAERDRERQ